MSTPVMGVGFWDAVYDPQASVANFIEWASSIGRTFEVMGKGMGTRGLYAAVCLQASPSKWRRLASLVRLVVCSLFLLTPIAIGLKFFRRLTLGEITLHKKGASFQELHGHFA